MKNFEERQSKSLKTESGEVISSSIKGYMHVVIGRFFNHLQSQNPPPSKVKKIRQKSGEV